MKYVSGDILSYPCNYIVQQCNCQTTTSKGLSESIFRKWPESNTYNNGKKRVPGTIDVINVTNDNKYIVNLYGQNKPGSVSGTETWQRRLQWFESGLNHLVQHIEPNTVVAFPYMIGCGLAGGNWLHYEPKIMEFSGRLAYKGVTVVIVCLQ